MTSNTNEDGWINLVVLGISLRKKGINYVKLSKLLRNFGHLIEIKTDNNYQPAVSSVRLK
ncbi:MAG: hypothetical protein ACPG49_06050 [Chitinophagales bacterium]